MAEKILNTRVLLKTDTLENWNNSTLPLKKGELALATVASSAGTGLTEPVVMIKVGEDGAPLLDAQGRRITVTRYGEGKLMAGDANGFNTYIQPKKEEKAVAKKEVEHKAIKKAKKKNRKPFVGCRGFFCSYVPEIQSPSAANHPNTPSKNKTPPMPYMG